MAEANETEQLCRKERERQRHRREILKAAERIFASKGYHAATIEEIAKEAQFAVGTLYNLFKGKDDLYTRVLESFGQDLMRQFEERVLSVSDPELAIASLIELRLTHFHVHREFIRVAFEASLSSRLKPIRDLPPSILEMHDRYTKAVEGIFARGIAEGKFDRTDPLYLTLCLEGIINAFVAYWVTSEPTTPLEQRIRKMKREFIERIKFRLPAEAEQAVGAVQGEAAAFVEVEHT